MSWTDINQVKGWFKNHLLLLKLVVYVHKIQWGEWYSLAKPHIQFGIRATELMWAEEQWLKEGPWVASQNPVSWGVKRAGKHSGASQCGTGIQDSRPRRPGAQDSLHIQAMAKSMITDLWMTAQYCSTSPAQPSPVQPSHNSAETSTVLPGTSQDESISTNTFEKKTALPQGCKAALVAPHMQMPVWAERLSKNLESEY